VKACRILSAHHASFWPHPSWIFACSSRWLQVREPISPPARPLQGFRSPSPPGKTTGLQPITLAPRFGSGQVRAACVRPLRYPFSDRQHQLRSESWGVEGTAFQSSFMVFARSLHDMISIDAT
jgi:hypothetical protein